MSSRTDRSTGKDAETKLKLAMENIKTLQATLNETQEELESLLMKHEELTIRMQD